MLKLMKYEIIHSYRTFITSFVVFLIGCTAFPLVTGLENIENIPVLSFLMMFIYFGFFVLIFGIVLALIVSIFVNYNNSMFKKPAYLTLTLPISTTELILSKVIVTMIWLTISCFVFVGGFVLMLLVMAFLENSLDLGTIINSATYFVEESVNYVVFDALECLIDVLNVVSTLLSTIGLIYFSLTVVHTKLVRNHQTVIGVILYFVISFIIQLITSIIFSGLDNMLIANIMINLITGVLFVAGTIYIIDHHIEIE